MVKSNVDKMSKQIFKVVKIGSHFKLANTAGNNTDGGTVINFPFSGFLNIVFVDIILFRFALIIHSWYPIFI